MKSRIAFLLCLLGLVWFGRAKINQFTTKLFYKNSITKPGSAKVFQAVNLFDVVEMDLYFNKLNVSLETTQNGETLLTHSIKNRNFKAVKYLVENSADVNIPNALGKKPLTLALQYGHEDMADYLQANGATRNSLADDFTSPYKNMSQGELFQNYSRALMARDLGKATDIIKAGLDPNYMNDQGANYPLFLAVQHGSTPLIKILLEKGADPNSLGPNTSQPIFFLALSKPFPNKETAINSFLKHGVDLSMKDPRGNTAVSTLNNSPDPMREKFIQKITQQQRVTGK